jgi:hypothetical protein
MLKKIVTRGCLVVAVAILFTTCIGYNYNACYSDQDLQGKIGGNEWSCQSGKAEYVCEKRHYLAFSLYSSDNQDPCAVEDYSSKVMFSLPAEEGVYKLKSSIRSLSNNTVATLYDATEKVNNIATNGVIEIIEIDTVNKMIKSRACIDGGEDNYVDGNFMVYLCN